MKIKLDIGSGPVVTITAESDLDTGINEVVDQLVVPALLASGYHPGTVACGLSTAIDQIDGLR